MLVSEAKLSTQTKRLIWGIVGASCVVVLISAVAGNIPVPGLLIVAGVVGLTYLIMSMTVTIDIETDSLVIRCKPFYAATLSFSSVVLAREAPSTSATEGFGLRALGDNTKGVLVGGPAVLVETTSRKWVVSAQNPGAVASRINESLPHT